MECMRRSFYTFASAAHTHKYYLEMGEQYVGEEENHKNDI